MNESVATMPKRQFRIRAAGSRLLRFLSRVCPLLDLAAPFPGVLAHHRGPSLLTGHKRAFHAATVRDGLQASAYFRGSGISALADANGGICTFRMGQRIALYQVTNSPLVNDDLLAPSTDTNRELFGDFMGSLDNDHPERPAKRAVVERTLGSTRFVEALEPAIRRHATEFLRESVGREMPIDNFALSLVAYVDSLIPGVLDLTQRPLTSYLASSEYGGLVRSFFDIASDVISKVNPQAMNEFNAIVPFVRDLLHQNLDAIAEAPDTNMIRRQFVHWGHELTHSAVDQLADEQLKELGTIIVATYDTTALSLLWTLAYLETAPALKEAVAAGVRKGRSPALSMIDFVVLEALRLGGSNPTALWRRTTRPFTLNHREHRVTVPAGTMIWLDRYQANRNESVFPRPNRFDPNNIRAIVRPGRETVSSLLSRNRYEINSFSMINSRRNPRKCPGRIFSVRMQSIIVSEIYRNYDTAVRGIDLDLKNHSSMPRPKKPGVIRIEVRSVDDHEWGGR